MKFNEYPFLCLFFFNFFMSNMYFKLMLTIKMAYGVIMFYHLHMPSCIWGHLLNILK